MDVSQIENNDASKNQFNLDEFDLESYDLNPLTSGLGFHHEKKKIVSWSSRNKQGSLHKKALSEESSIPSFESREEEMGLGVFYKHVSVPHSEKKKSQKLSVKKKSFQDAKEIDQFLAFALDIFTLFICYNGVFLSFLWSAGVPLRSDAINIFFMDFWPYLFSLSCMIFLFYFTLLDSFGTLGKRLQKIQSVNTLNARPASLGRSFLRAFASLISIFLLGIPFLIDFQGRLSKTKLIKA